jgi:hypothetical protein
MIIQVGVDMYIVRFPWDGAELLWFHYIGHKTPPAVPAARIPTSPEI